MLVEGFSPLKVARLLQVASPSVVNWLIAALTHLELQGEQTLSA